MAHTEHEKSETAEASVAQDTPETVAPVEEAEVVEATVEEPVAPAASAAKSEPEPETAPVAPAPRRGGFVPLFLGGVIAAALGAGATVWALPNLPPQLAAMIPMGTDRTAALEAEIAASNAKLDTLTAELKTLKSATPPPPDLSGVQAALDETGSATRAMQETLSALETRVTALENRPAAAVAGGSAPVDLSGIQAQIDTLRAEMATGGPAEAAAREQIAAAVAAAQAQIGAVRDEAGKLSAGAEAAAQRAVAQAAVARVAAAFESGAPMAPALADAQAAGLTVPAVLAADVPTLSALQSAFPEAARAGLAASRKAAPGQTLGARFKAFFMAQTGARSLAPRAGEDADAVLSRAQAAVDAGDLVTAMTEISALPQAGQAVMTGWLTQAQKRLDAAQAVTELAQSVK